MANVNWIMSFRVADADGEIFSVPLYGYSADTRTIANLQGTVTNLATLLDAILDGKVVQAQLCLGLSLSLATIKGSAVAGSEIERTGLIPYLLYNSNPIRHWSQDLPAFKYSKFLSGTNQIDMADSDVAAWVAATTSSSGEIFTDPAYFHSLEQTGEGFKSFRKHRRQTKRT